MIKFFRKIRQNMIKENRASKYLLYAIGEIVLVVIGILIALSINNWNDSRKDNLREQTYYKTVINDLVNDTVLINKKIHDNVNKMNHNENLRKRIHSKHVTIDTIINIAQDEFFVENISIPDFNNNTFETLIASGDLSLLNTSIKGLLLSLDSEQKKITEEMTTLDKIYQDKLGRYSDRYPVPARAKENRTDIEKGIWLQIDKQDFLPRFINILDLGTFMCYDNLDKLEGLKTSTIEVLDSINKQIDL
jgi:Family of unknown function (DUF6090)